MTTIVFIENLQGSGKAIKIVEDFGDYAVHRDLAPGEHACIGVQRLKSLHIEEVPLADCPVVRRIVQAPPAPALSEPQLELRYG
ncbi:MAG TPA: hypothetical protein VG939_12890 [Caulobacteraceae bacterium]|nr:hypothetical protein [Caulobacteraceae bacterium]